MLHDNWANFTWQNHKNKLKMQIYFLKYLERGHQVGHKFSRGKEKNVNDTKPND